MPSTNEIMKNSNSGTAMEQIRKLETVLQAELPPDYVEFLRVHNGGIPAKPCSTFLDETGSETQSGIGHFYGVDTKEDDLEHTWRYYLEEERVPPGYLPIADDVFGNMLLLGIDEQNSGQVYFWDHEREYLEDEQMISIVASSFSAFLESLTE
jgi:cell wall assembly regulator SMI1